MLIYSRSCVSPCNNSKGMGISVNDANENPFSTRGVKRTGVKNKRASVLLDVKVEIKNISCKSKGIHEDIKEYNNEIQMMNMEVQEMYDEYEEIYCIDKVLLLEIQKLIDIIQIIANKTDDLVKEIQLEISEIENLVNMIHQIIDQTHGSTEILDESFDKIFLVCLEIREMYGRIKESYEVIKSTDKHIQNALNDITETYFDLDSTFDFNCISEREVFNKFKS